MIVITGKTNSTQSHAVIRHKDFAKRLGIACENSPQAPAAHGRQIWLKNQLEAQFNEPVSREAVRKWFAGEAKPKPKMMSLVARALGVDEAWLAIGSTPNITVSEKKSRNILASGAANMVAAQIQLAGGSVAFPDEGGVGIDLDTIVKGEGRQLLRVQDLHQVFSKFPCRYRSVRRSSLYPRTHPLFTASSTCQTRS